MERHRDVRGLGRLHHEDFERVVSELLDIGITEGMQRWCPEQQDRPGLNRPACLDQNMPAYSWLQFCWIKAG